MYEVIFIDFLQPGMGGFTVAALQIDLSDIKIVLCGERALV